MIAIVVVVGLGVTVLLVRYAARRGDSGSRVQRLASGGGLCLGGGLAKLFSDWRTGVAILTVGAVWTTLFLLWFRRPRVGPPRRY
jgi:hypothetical protein